MYLRENKMWDQDGGIFDGLPEGCTKMAFKLRYEYKEVVRQRFGGRLWQVVKSSQVLEVCCHMGSCQG